MTAWTTRIKRPPPSARHELLALLETLEARFPERPVILPGQQCLVCGGDCTCDTNRISDPEEARC